MSDQNVEADLGLPVRRSNSGEASPLQDTFSVDDVSSLMGISRDEITRAIYEGELKAMRAEEAIVGIRRSDLLAWLDARGPGV